jgi:hypothetical protein
VFARCLIRVNDVASTAAHDAAVNWTDLYHLSSNRPEGAQVLMQHAMAAVHASANTSLQFSVAGAPASAFAICLALDAYGVPTTIDSATLLQPAA